MILVGLAFQSLGRVGASREGVARGLASSIGVLGIQVGPALGLMWSDLELSLNAPSGVEVNAAVRSMPEDLGALCRFRSSWSVSRMYIPPNIGQSSSRSSTDYRRCSEELARGSRRPAHSSKIPRGPRR